MESTRKGVSVCLDKLPYVNHAGNIWFQSLYVQYMSSLYQVIFTFFFLVLFALCFICAYLSLSLCYPKVWQPWWKDARLAVSSVMDGLRVPWPQSTLTLFPFPFSCACLSVTEPFRVQAASSISCSMTQFEGVPQGCVLSATLFLIAIHYIISSLLTGVWSSLYVHDLAIYTSGFSFSRLQHLIQSAFNTFLLCH